MCSWRTWNPQRGTEPGKIRPVVVVQTDLLNGLHHPRDLPVTTNLRPQAAFLRVHLAAGEGGLAEKSDIIVDQIRAIDNRRFLQRTGKISRKSQAKLKQNLAVLLN